MRKRLSRSQRVQAVLIGMCAFTRRTPRLKAEPKPPRPTSLLECITAAQGVWWGINPYAVPHTPCTTFSWSPQGGALVTDSSSPGFVGYKIRPGRTTVVYDTSCPPQPLQRGVTTYDLGALEKYSYTVPKGSRVTCVYDFGGNKIGEITE
jgi:hypothetical protein